MDSRDLALEISALAKMLAERFTYEELEELKKALQQEAIAPTY